MHPRSVMSHREHTEHDTETNVTQGSEVKDPVNHPSHYNSHPSGVECIAIVEHMTFCAGNAVKYLWRSGLKDGSPDLQDLEKAKWYVEREIGRLKRSRAK